MSVIYVTRGKRYLPPGKPLISKGLQTSQSAFAKQHAKQHIPVHKNSYSFLLEYQLFLLPLQAIKYLFPRVT